MQYLQRRKIYLVLLIMDQISSYIITTFFFFLHILFIMAEKTEEKTSNFLKNINKVRNIEKRNKHKRTTENRKL